jgi:DNA-binding transcriptional regulator YiaG
MNAGSVTVEKYKIKGKVYATIDDIALAYGVSHGTAGKWVTRRMTPDRDFIRLITIILNEKGKEIDVEDFATTR